jgi:hypothetical protein
MNEPCVTLSSDELVSPKKRILGARATVLLPDAVATTIDVAVAETTVPSTRTTFAMDCAGAAIGITDTRSAETINSVRITLSKKQQTALGVKTMVMKKV